MDNGKHIFFDAVLFLRFFGICLFQKAKTR